MAAYWGWRQAAKGDRDGGTVQRARQGRRRRRRRDRKSLSLARLSQDEALAEAFHRCCSLLLGLCGEHAGSILIHLGLAQIPLPMEPDPQ